MRRTIKIIEICFVYGRLVPTFTALSSQAFSEITFCFFWLCNWSPLWSNQHLEPNYLLVFTSTHTLHRTHSTLGSHSQISSSLTIFFRYSLVPLLSILMIILYLYIKKKEQSTKQDSTHFMIQVLQREKSEHRNIQYASSKVPLELWMEGRLRQSTICPQIYVWIDEKDQITDVNNIGNWPREYTLDDTGLGTGKFWPQEYSIRSLKAPT